MILENKETIVGMSYSSVTKELKIKYNNGNVVVYKEVPDGVFESIKNNGRVINNQISETLNAYQKIQLV